MTVLVTGATGLLGSHLVELLLERGTAVRALVRPGDDADWLEHCGVEVCRGDMVDRASLAAAVRGVERVLHCAARTGVWGPKSEYEAVNVRGLGMLLEEALAAGARRFVHVSSIAVHGADVQGTASEDTPRRIDPNPYSWSKVMGEQLLEKMIREQGALVTIVRPGWVYGPRDVASFGRFAAMVEGGRMLMMGRGHNHVPLIYAADVARGTLQASESPRAVGRKYLLVNDERVTQADYFSAMARELRVAPPRRHVPYRLALIMGALAEGATSLAHRAQPPLTRYGVQLLGGENVFVIGRARRELGFVPQVSLAEGVEHSMAWYRDVRAGRNGGERRP